MTSRLLLFLAIITPASSLTIDNLQLEKKQSICRRLSKIALCVTKLTGLILRRFAQWHWEKVAILITLPTFCIIFDFHKESTVKKLASETRKKQEQLEQAKATLKALTPRTNAIEQTLEQEQATHLSIENPFVSQAQQMEELERAVNQHQLLQEDFCRSLEECFESYCQSLEVNQELFLSMLSKALLEKSSQEINALQLQGTSIGELLTKFKITVIKCELSIPQLQVALLELKKQVAKKKQEKDEKKILEDGQKRLDENAKVLEGQVKSFATFIIGLGQLLRPIALFGEVSTSSSAERSQQRIRPIYKPTNSTNEFIRSIDKSTQDFPTTGFAK